MEINKNCQKLFEILGYIPLDVYDANNFLRSYYDLESDRTITANFTKPVMCDGQPITQITISPNNFLDAFYPQIWSQLKFGQKLLAVMHAYKFVINSDVNLQKNKPQLIFNAEYDDVDLGGLVADSKKIELNISLEYLIKKNSNPITILNTIAHELYHGQQIIWAKSSKNSNEYNKELKSSFSGNVWIYLNNAIHSNDLQEDLIFSAEDCKRPLHNIKYFDYWVAIKDDSAWLEILYMAYLNCAKESGAFNKASKFSNSAIKYFEKHFGKIPDKYFSIDNSSVEELNKDSIENLNSLGYNIKLEDCKVFQNINSQVLDEFDKFAGETNFNIEIKGFFDSKVWNALKQLLDIHKNKCVKQQEYIM